MSSTSTTIQSKVVIASYSESSHLRRADLQNEYGTNRRLPDESYRTKQPHQVITANPIMVMAAQDDPAYLSMMQRAELIVPDGTGVVWAAKYVGEPVAERVPGYDLIHELMKVGESKSWKVYLLGASNEVIQAAAEKLRTAIRRSSSLEYGMAILKMRGCGSDPRYRGCCTRSASRRQSGSESRALDREIQRTIGCAGDDGGWGKF